MHSLPTKIKTRLSTRSIYGIILLIVFGIALALRISLPYDSIFADGGVRFIGADPWYHMRLVENLVHNFPHRILFDPYALYPNGHIVDVAPFFDLLLGSLVWIISLGSPSQSTMETVSVYFPAILGALVTIPVYFIGREIFNRNVGLLSAALIAILPGQFLVRSLLGFTDHHVAEVLFSTTAVLFLILAIKRAKANDISFNHIWSRDWGNLRKPLLYALLAGISLGIYVLSWTGALLFVFLIFVYLVTQYIIDHLRGRSTDYLCIIGMPMFLIALIMVIPFSSLPNYGGIVNVSLAIAVLTSLVLSGVSLLMAHSNIRRLYYPLALGCLGLAGVGVLYAVNPSLLSSLVEAFGRVFTPSVSKQAVGEMKPLLSLSGLFSLLFYFTTNIILAFISLGLIIYAQTKKWNSEKIFLTIWCLIILSVMLGQARFAYYFAVNVSILSGYLCWRILDWSRGNLRKSAKYNEKVTKRAVDSKERRRSFGSRFILSNSRLIGAAIAVLLIACVPSIAVTIGIARDPLVPNDAWYSSLSWMREHTPDPFGDPDFYYALYDKPPTGEAYDYPESAYGVMSWWDNGYWINYIAHRIPNTNPGGQAHAEEAAKFFIAQDESSANDVLDELGSQYVIIDLGMDTGKFGSMATWAGKDESQFLEVYYQGTNGGALDTKTLYYPEYYQSLCSRLYNFDGKPVIPHNSTMIVSYKESTVLGINLKEILSTQIFATYEKAQEYLESQNAPNYRIVGDSPFISPVPIEELEHYKLVHQSDPEMVELDNRYAENLVSYVKIFEYLP